MDTHARGNNTARTHDNPCKFLCRRQIQGFLFQRRHLPMGFLRLQIIRLTDTLMLNLQCCSFSILVRANRVVLGHRRHRAQRPLLRLRAQRTHLSVQITSACCLFAIFKKDVFFFGGSFVRVFPECANQARTRDHLVRVAQFVLVLTIKLLNFEIVDRQTTERRHGQRIGL